MHKYIFAKYGIWVFYLIWHGVAMGQIECDCSSNKAPYQNIRCNSDTLTTGQVLYYQYNCDSTWLTLQSKNNKKVLFSSSFIWNPEHGRLNPQLVNEFAHCLLFRYGCAANGPCSYFTVNKISGTKIREFETLIFTGDGVKTNFVIGIGNMNLLLFNHETQQTTYIPFNTQLLTDANLEYHFEPATIKNGLLVLPYSYQIPYTQTRISKTVVLEIYKYN